MNIIRTVRKVVDSNKIFMVSFYTSGIGFLSDEDRETAFIEWMNGEGDLEGDGTPVLHPMGYDRHDHSNEDGSSEEYDNYLVTLRDVFETVPVKYYVNEYIMGQSYGGPEEGGWYYSTGQYKKTHLVTDDENKALKMMRKFNDNRNYRMSDGDYICCSVEDHKGCNFPAFKPRYC